MSYLNPLVSPVVANLPAQMIPASKKTQEWKETCMDVLEQVGRVQYNTNLYLIENYEMVKGKFIYSHYFENEGYTDYMAQLTREFELPSYLRHYDIISQVINTLVGEYIKRPDMFRIENFSEDATNQYERDRTELIHKYVNSQINAEISKKLLEMGLDPEKDDFNTDEEAQQYQQVIQQATQQLTPPEIEDYMSTKWVQQAELWASHQLKLDKRRYTLEEKEMKEFQDMLVADRCFRHFYLTPTGFNQETWNPVQVFFDKSPTVEYIEEGNYVGRTFYMSMSTIVDRYGHLMPKSQLEELETKITKPDKRWNYMAGTEYVFDEYMMPFKGYQGYDIARNTAPNVGLENIDEGFLNSLYSGKFFNDRRDMFFVTEAYWVSQIKIGKVVYIDPETGIKTRDYVDENFIVPEHFTELNSSFSDTDEIDSITWTWVNQVWKGKKIGLKHTPFKKDIYFDINPLDFEFKGDFNPYGAKLPVVGQVFSIRNSQSMSLVDLMKPYQIFYNVAMNQLYQIMEREIGRFIVWDVNMFLNTKDWGGEKGMEKWLMMARQYGIVPADTSVTNIKQSLAASGGYLPKDYNFDDSARMISRLNLANAFEQMALKQVGFNQYRLGAYGSEATAAGVQAGQETSYAQTESYFTNFSNYLRRCYEMDLAMAQYVQAKDQDATIMYTKSDMSRAYIKISGTELLTADLHVRVVNSQEYIRQLETLRQLAIENNTSGASLLDLAHVITANSVEEIKIKLQTSAKKMEDMQQQEFQQKQQEIDQQNQLAQAKLAQDEDHFQKELQNKLDVAYIEQGTKVLTSGSDIQPTEPTAVPDTSSDQSKQQLENQKFVADKEYKNKKLALDQAKMQNDLVIQQQKVNLTKIMKGKKK